MSDQARPPVPSEDDILQGLDPNRINLATPVPSAINSPVLAELVAGVTAAQTNAEVYRRVGLYWQHRALLAEQALASAAGDKAQNGSADAADPKRAAKVA